MSGSENSIKKLSESIPKLWEALRTVQEQMQGLIARVALLESKMTPTQEPLENDRMKNLVSLEAPLPVAPKIDGIEEIATVWGVKRGSSESVMVKAVVGEETPLNLVEERRIQFAVPTKVGQVIHKFSSILDRGLVFDWVPTPPNDSDEPTCAITNTSRDGKKRDSESKSQAVDSSSLFFDKDWVVEDAC